MHKGAVAVILRVGLTAGLAASLTFTGIGAAEETQAATPGQACLFNAPYGAEFLQTPLFFGHVGWGYQDGTGDNWVYGADEGGGVSINPGPPSSIQAWSTAGSFQQMLHDFGLGTHYGKGAGYYVSYKCVAVANANPAAALSAINEQYTNGYFFATNTCLTKAIAILQAYGANMAIATGAALAPNYYYNVVLAASSFSPPAYLTTLTIGVKVVDARNHSYLNLNPVHKQRPIRVIINNPNGQIAYDSGPFSAGTMATVTPGTDRYQITLQLPPDAANYHGLWENGPGSNTYGAVVQLQYTLPSFLSVTISQGVNNTPPDTLLTAGDINQDGAVNIADYNLLLQCFSDISPPVGPCPPAAKAAADITDDGSVNGFDYNEMLRIFIAQGHS